MKKKKKFWGALPPDFRWGAYSAPQTFSCHFTCLWHVCFLFSKKPMRPYFFCIIPWKSFNNLFIWFFCFITLTFLAHFFLFISSFIYLGSNFCGNTFSQIIFWTFRGKLFAWMKINQKNSQVLCRFGLHTSKLPFFWPFWIFCWLTPFAA